MTPEPADWSYPLGLFDAFGVELEYMIVDRGTLDVKPICDALFRSVTGGETSDVEPDGPGGVVSWSNELALHVVELKTQRPIASLDGLAGRFQENVRRIDALLEPMNARLLPTAMHPWMDPNAETRLWPHEYNDIYLAYDRIFGCRGHGWGNLQSTHINLPFANDEEFGRLHAALRLVLPLLPALAASSPIVDGRRSSLRCHRMEVYRTNSQRVPMMVGLVAPEPVFTRQAYERDILGRLYEQLRPLDPEGVLRHEFANARGAMARFDRGAIEIRVLDIQECPRADMAIAAFVIELTRAVVAERWMRYEDQQRITTEALHGVLLETIRDAERARIKDRSLLDAFGGHGDEVRAGDLLRGLAPQVLPDHPVWTPLLTRMLDAGTLSSRIVARLPESATREELHAVYAELADCLHRGELFDVP
ncbi:MAG: glutamate--cysteine ligase [Phycisphaeraceae bacterium]|nr:glutamate--cysteine ligase [Phycisphaeraceae bacterium]MCB9847528.1 glutamate--cysteine ligase [Phycisphaeraceae bacterium]